MTHILSGRDIAHQIIENNLKPRAQALRNKGIVPKLVVIMVGENAASASYIKQKERTADLANVESEVRHFGADITEDALIQEIESINQDETLHGVIVQLPVPEHISVARILRTISPEKDVDGFTPTQMGKLFLGEDALQCCTPKGIMMMIDTAPIDLRGKHAVIVGRSNIVGKPVAQLLLQRDATVTMCHRHTPNLREYTVKADILVVAVGKPNLIGADDIKDGAIVIDVGINRLENGKLCGDVDYESVAPKAAFITPVPGGVGPMTVVSLIQNTLQAAEHATERE